MSAIAVRYRFRPDKDSPRLSCRRDKFHCLCGAEIPYIQITWVQGRCTDQKRIIAKQITDVVEKEGRAKRENIHVAFVDLAPSNHAETGVTVEDRRKSAK
jgi:phenylpyruvate tautomerase PptA (4-oxalocrotonate tautomerase family)